MPILTKTTHHGLRQKRKLNLLRRLWQPTHTNTTILHSENRSPSNTQTFCVGCCQALDKNKMGTTHQCLLVILWINFNKLPEKQFRHTLLLPSTWEDLKSSTRPYHREMRIKLIKQILASPSGWLWSKGQMITSVNRCVEALSLRHSGESKEMNKVN